LEAADAITKNVIDDWVRKKNLKWNASGSNKGK
jgi:hypothetical protein